MGGQPFQQHQAYNQASFSLPPEHTAGPLPVKYLLQEAHWPHPGLPQSHVLGHGMPFGLQAMAHRQEQGPLTLLQHQQQKQQLQAPQSTLHSVEEVSGAFGLFNCPRTSFTASMSILPLAISAYLQKLNSHQHNVTSNGQFSLKMNKLQTLWMKGIEFVLKEYSINEY